MNIGFYAGSFDPFTFGHLNVIEKSSAILDKVIVGIGSNNTKSRRYDKNKMKEAMEKIFAEKGLNNVEVVCYSNLSVDTAKEFGANILIRGIRNGMDYAYEENLAQINYELSGLDTIYIRAGKYGVISSSMVYDLILSGKDVSRYVPQGIIKAFNI